jgi:MFS family permease
MKIKGNPTLILLLASISSFLTPFMGSAVNISLPEIGRAFSMNAIMLNWVSTSYLIASAVLILPFGRAADLFGKKCIFLWGNAAFALSTLLVAFSPTAEAIIFFRVMQGLAVP